ncbi:MAG: DNA alkylation repair protein [Actinomycetota bacterium]
MSRPSVDAVVRRLRSLARPGGREGMARFGINPERALGVRIPDLRRVAGEIGTDHGLALRLWRTGIHEARILASMIDDPARVTERQADAWVRAFDSWDLCDQCCGNLFDRTPFAARKARQWARSDEEFVRRAGFAVMAWKAVHDREASDRVFLEFLPVIERTSDDPRNFVKKAVNWALRQIGKRNRRLNRAAIGAAKRIARRGTASARWVASDGLRELRSKKVLERLG